MHLSFDIHFSDFNHYEGLVKIDAQFISYLKQHNQALHKEFLLFRSGSITEPQAVSAFLIETSKILENFLYKLFNLSLKSNQYEKAKLIAQCHRNFVQRVALRQYKSAQDIVNFDYKAFRASFEGKTFIENFAHDVHNAEKNLDNHAKYAASAHFLGIDDHFMFHAPKKYQGNDYLTFEYDPSNNIYSSKAKQRDGFNLTDHGSDISYIIDQTNYCIYCHNQQKDSCSKGLKEKDGTFKNSYSNIKLSGCPLDEKISEMNFLKYHGHNLAAFAIALVDNPMIAATGHRICNDCMKSCIYQKQEPVNIPEIETNILKEVLALPWGFEIYNLLTLWNPLKAEHFLPQRDTHNKILVVGLGPAGFTIAHYLSIMGHEVMAIDGLKIEPLDQNILNPIANIQDYFEPLGERVADGFGGVMEYGITNRWNKNYLKLIRIILERRKNIKICGGIRFGSNITPTQAKALGFQHIVMCTGAGKPHLLDIPNGFARGVRTASDFLMSLQLTGAAHQNTLSNLQLRMPIIVIGGGLTAIDAATEALAYYPIQVEKFLQQYEKFGTQLNLTQEEQIIAAEFIQHAKLLREEKKKNNPDVLGLLNRFGGAKILYRKSIQESPAYRNNHEEVAKALAEGIKIIEHANPKEVKLDSFGHINAICIEYKNNFTVDFPAKTLLIAAGTTPNTSIADEFAEFFIRDGKHFRLIQHTPSTQDSFLTYKDDDAFAISFLGDAHPDYSGNVVKAMASAKKSYQYISALLPKAKKIEGFLDNIAREMKAQIQAINLLGDNIIELIVYAPLAARNFRPGQFFKLQNYTKAIHSRIPALEPIALTGASADPETGLISLVILEMGGSSSLCRYLSIGEEVILMGPTGKPTEIQHKEKALLIGGGLGNAVLFSIGKEIKNKGGTVTYFAGYKKLKSIFKKEEITNAADSVVWCAENGLMENLPINHYAFQGNIVQALEYYNKHHTHLFNESTKVIVIGSDQMMAAVQDFLITKKTLSKNQKCQLIASINSPMQCMMKEICGQCIQRHYNSETNVEHFVFSCNNQDQDMKSVDFVYLSQRLTMNSLAEKITALVVNTHCAH